MRYHELDEAIAPYNVFFHFTGMAVLLRIIHENRLQANRLMNADIPTISFTRDSTPGSGSRLGLPYHRSAACLIFNASKIKTTPHAGDVGKHQSHWKEMEERHDGDLHNVLDKLIAICIATENYPFDVTKNLWREERPQQAQAWQELTVKCREHNIPIKFVPRFDSGWYLHVRS